MNEPIGAALKITSSSGDFKLNPHADDSPNQSNSEPAHASPASPALFQGALITTAFCMLFGFAFCRIRLDLGPDAVYFRMVWGPIGFAFAYIAIVWLLNKLGIPVRFRIGQVTVEEAIAIILNLTFVVVSILLANIGQPIR